MITRSPLPHKIGKRRKKKKKSGPKIKKLSTLMDL
jgi:hypothetical protein